MSRLRPLAISMWAASAIGCSALPAGSNATDGGDAALCATYCAEAAQHCSGVTADIDETSTCATTCSRFPATGEGGDTSGDTVQCRIYHLGAPAAADPNTHCYHGGVSGGNVCGAWCDVYCREAMTNCSGTNALYSTSAACMTACAGLSSTGKPGDQSGNTVQCRIYHLNMAATSPDNATLHCPHGAVNSSPCM